MAIDMITKIHYISAVCLAIGIMCCAVSAAGKELQISMDCSNHNTVIFTVKNDSTKKINVLLQALPWSINSFSMRYDGYLVNDGNTSALSHEHILADYFTNRIIPSKGSISGADNLNSIFRDLSKLRYSGDIVIHWSFDSYRLSSPLSVWRTTESGVILLPRKWLLSVPCGGVVYGS